MTEPRKCATEVRRGLGVSSTSTGMDRFQCSHLENSFLSMRLVCSWGSCWVINMEWQNKINVPRRTHRVIMWNIVMRYYPAIVCFVLWIKTDLCRDSFLWLRCRNGPPKWAATKMTLTSLWGIFVKESPGATRAEERRVPHRNHLYIFIARLANYVLRVLMSRGFDCQTWARLPC